ncbi:MAG: HIT domain-containing protein [Candidatus Thermoplasmatota archaeon]|nr:HIT domain-containing protein [Candidatus Thermoplasmatota archaeon]
MYDVLFAPSRGKYVGKKPNVDCLLCAIRDKNPEVWTRRIYEDDKIMVIMNIFPYSPGHVQVIPNRHVEDLSELSDDELEYTMDFVQRSIKFVGGIMEPDGFNIGINLGKSGASIKHIHVQIVPRYNRKTVEIEQEKIHKQYLENVDLLKNKIEIEEKKEKCICLKEKKYVLKKNPLVYVYEKPYNRGHVVVSPLNHVNDINQLSSSDLLSLFKEVINAKNAIENIYHPVGFNIGMNIGNIPNSSSHLQIHVVPRYDPETGFMEVIGDTRVVVESLEQSYEKIKTVFMKE